MLLVTQWKPYDGVSATSSAIHKLELDLKRKLKYELANEHGLPKKDRGSERLKISLDKIKRYNRQDATEPYRRWHCVET